MGRSPFDQTGETNIPSAVIPSSGDRPLISFDELEELLAADGWAELSTTTVVIPGWGPPPFYVFEGRL
jgi:hypothetical protein